MKDFSGMFLTVKNNLTMSLRVFNMSTMLKWIREEEISKEILSPGGDNITTKMDKSVVKLNSKTKNMALLTL